MSSLISDIYKEITGKKLTSLALGLILLVGSSWYYIATDKLEENQEILIQLSTDYTMLMEKLVDSHKQIMILQIEVETLEAKVLDLQKKIDNLDERDRTEFNKLLEKIYKHPHRTQP